MPLASVNDDEAIAVLHHQMPHVAEFGLLAGALSKQPSVGVGGRGMRVILAFLAMEVSFGIAPATAVLTFPRRRLAAVLRHEAFHAGPGLDQRAVDREVLTREELADFRQVQHANHELTGNIAVEQPIPVLAEHGRIPHRIVGREPDEPAEQQIIVELLHQLQFRTHRVERLKQQRAQQPFRRDRRSAIPGIELGECPRQFSKRCIDKLANHSQRMVRWNTLVQPNIAEQNLGAIILAAHRFPQQKGTTHAQNHTPADS